MMAIRSLRPSLRGPARARRCPGNGKERSGRPPALAARTGATGTASESFIVIIVTTRAASAAPHSASRARGRHGRWCRGEPGAPAATTSRMRSRAFSPLRIWAIGGWPTASSASLGAARLDLQKGRIHHIARWLYREDALSRSQRKESTGLWSGLTTRPTTAPEPACHISPMVAFVCCSPENPF